MINLSSDEMDAGCVSGPAIPIVEDDWMEMEVIPGFRVWQLMFLALAGLITVVVLLCCFMKCRVPRTKQEIEADFKRKEITRRFRFLLDRVQVEDTSLRTAIEKVNELYTNREKMKKRKRKKPDEEEEIISMDSSYLFEDEKLTIVQRAKKLLGLLKQEDSDSEEESSQKEKSEKSEKSEKNVKQASDDDLSSLPNIHKVSIADKVRQFSEESRESFDSPKMVDSHSKLSLLQDSPPRTHDTLSKLSFLQDSPPNCGLSLLQDTPPHQRKLSKQDSTTDSQDSQKSLGKQKTESQESHDSESSTKKQDSQDSDKTPRKKLGFLESTKAKHKSTTSDSQDSEDGAMVKQKSSNSQDSEESDKSKNKKKFEPRDSKLTRRESVAGQVHEVANKIVQKASPLTKAKSSQKSSKSLDVNLS